MAGEYLDIINITEDQGIIKKIIKNGEGELPKDGQEIIAHYEGTLLDNTVFDSSYSRNEPFTFLLGAARVIKAWDKTFATMKKGEQALIIAKPEYAYGESGSPPKIPPNSTLQFKVELIDFRDRKKEKWEMSKEEKVNEATKLKEYANIKFKDSKFNEAYENYKNSLEYIELEDELDSFKIALFNNLSITACKNNELLESINYAKKALEIDSKNIKSLYRKAYAESQKCNIEDSNNTITEILSIDEHNKEALSLSQNNKIKQKKQLIAEKKMFKNLF